MKGILSLFFAMCLVVTLLTGCAAVPLHPGAINKSDSVTYDALLTAKSIIDTSRDQFKTGVLPDKLKPAVNAIAKVYDDAYPAYLSWHRAMQEGSSTQAQLNNLNALMAALNTAVSTFKGEK